jgi:hypothetical protein
MAIVQGGKSYGAHMDHTAAHPLTRPYAKSAADTTVILAGHPVALTSGSTGGNIVRRAAITSGVVSDAKILGFASHEEWLQTSNNYGTLGFAIPPKPQIPVASGAPSGLEQIQVNVADGITKFYYSVASGITVSQALVGQVAGFTQQDATNDIYVLDTGVALSGWKIAVITSVVPQDIGKTGGRVEFQIISTSRQWPQP